jgi:hypothetical protein
MLPTAERLDVVLPVQRPSGRDPEITAKRRHRRTKWTFVLVGDEDRRKREEG